MPAQPHEPVFLTQPVNLNEAGPETLRRVRGLGPTAVRQILEWRERHGPFTRVEDLLHLPVIGEARLHALRPRVRV